jgi:hypothetical protein
MPSGYGNHLAATDRTKAPYDLSVLFLPIGPVWPEFQLRPSETFLYTCGAIDLWEWEFRLLDQEPGADGDDAPLCLGGRGAAPPEHCGGPTHGRILGLRILKVFQTEMISEPTFTRAPWPLTVMFTPLRTIL